MYRFKKTGNDATEYIPLLAEKICIDKDVVACYLFGSYTEGKQTPASDVDLAVLLDVEFPAERYFEKKLDLLSIVTLSLKTDEVDLIILNQAPPLLSYRILSRGRLLFERGDRKGQKVNFQVRAFDRYFDFKPMEMVIHNGLVKRIKEGRFGG